MDLVDIDKVLDELETQEQSNAAADKQPQQPQSRPHPDTTPSGGNRRIKVRSVLSSLNDYVDYDRKQNDKSSPPPPAATGMCTWY